MLKPVENRQDSETHFVLDDELKHSIEELCNSKAEEFCLYGYENITGEQIWACVSEGYRRGWPNLNRLVNDILSLKANRFMNWLMISVYRTDMPAERLS